MTDRFCKNDDGNCPCLGSINISEYITYDCRLGPRWYVIGDPDNNYCYTGRQIMAEEASYRGYKQIPVEKKK